MSILVIGRSGQIARALARCAKGALALESIGRPQCDLAEPATISAAIGERRPRVVINAGAYTAVDKAESEPQLAHAVNATGAGALALAAPGPVIHLSTDYVFSGEKATPYVEEDPTVPLGVYGKTKLEGERLVMQATPKAIVLRTSWVFDDAGHNFVRTMLRLARQKEEIDVVSDQHGSPTFADDIAAAVLRVANEPAYFGVFHCAGDGEASWADFAEEVFRLSRQRGGPTAAVNRIASKDYRTRARRPANSRLNCDRFASAYGMRLRPWPDALAVCIDRIASGGWRLE